MSDDGLSSDDVEQLDTMLERLEEYYFRKGYPPREAYERAVEAVYENTGCAPRARGGRGGHVDSFSKWLDAAFGPFSSERSAPELSQRYREEPTDGTRRCRTKQPSRSTQSDRETEFDHMFQNGKDSNVARDLGRLMSDKEIKLGELQIICELIEKDADPDYARQQGKQFVIREVGKRVRTGLEAAGLLPDYDIDDEENEGCSGGREKRAQSGFDQHGICKTGAEERYNTSHCYTDNELRIIEAKIYYEWIKKGARPAKAHQEAQKWFNRNKGSRFISSSCRSGFDSFIDMHESLHDEESCHCCSRSSRGPRAGRKGAWDDPRFDQHFTEESKDSFRYSSRRGPRGYRTEERRPGGVSSGNCNGSGSGPSSHDRKDEPMEPSGVKPNEDLYVLLGVSVCATVNEIKAAHRRLCIKHHPDRAKDGPAAKKAATEKMAQINQAWDVLKEKKMRAFYDRTGLIASVGVSPDA